MLGLDLSDAYIRHARGHLKRWSNVDLIVANAEAIPAKDNSCDAVTSIFMLHELPKEVRRTVIEEAARVLKPGGRLTWLIRSNSATSPHTTRCWNASRTFITSRIITAISEKISPRSPSPTDLHTGPP